MIIGRVNLQIEQNIAPCDDLRDSSFGGGSGGRISSHMRGRWPT